MSHISHLKALQALELAIRKGSLKAAAEELNITAAAIGQRIKLLEDYLNVQLLQRGPHGVSPSPLLRLVMDDLEAGFKAIEKAAKILKQESRNEVVITADPSWYESWLRPRLAAFKGSYPDIQLLINPQQKSRVIKTDCRIEFAPDSNSAQCLFKDYLAPVVAKSIVQAFQAKEQPLDIQQLPLLHLDLYQPDPEALNWPLWVKKFAHPNANAKRGARFSHSTYALAAAASGAGLLLCGIALAQKALQHKKVVMPFTLQEGQWTSFGYQLFVAKESQQRPQVDKFCSWLLKESSITNDWLIGLVNSDGK